MDKKDLEILSLLQEDASAPLATLAEAINLSSTPCWRRIQKLQEDGVIQRQVALCDPEQLNLGLTAFVAVRTNLHNREWTERFVSGARDIPEIIEIYRMSGDIDYMLKVMVPTSEATTRSTRNSSRWSICLTSVRVSQWKWSSTRRHFPCITLT